MSITEPSTDDAARAAPAAADDISLVADILRKDRKATARFVALHTDAVYAYVRGRLIPRVDLVDDVVHETFLAALESLTTFSGTASLRTWLLGIARHKVEDHYRQRLREPEALSPLNEQALPTPPRAPQFDDTLDRARLHEKVRHVLVSLPARYRTALLWRYWEKRSARDMAAQTGRTEKAIERLLARAREEFKRRWDVG